MWLITLLLIVPVVVLTVNIGSESLTGMKQSGKEYKGATAKEIFHTFSNGKTGNCVKNAVCRAAWFMNVTKGELREFLDAVPGEITPELLRTARKSFRGRFPSRCSTSALKRGFDYGYCDCAIACDREKPIERPVKKYYISSDSSPSFTMVDRSDQTNVFICPLPKEMDYFYLNFYKCFKPSSPVSYQKRNMEDLVGELADPDEVIADNYHQFSLYTTGNCPQNNICRGAWLVNVMNRPLQNFLNLITNEITPELLEIAKKSYGGGYSASCGIFDRTRALYDNCDCEFTCDRSKPPPNTVNNAHAKYRNSKPEEEYYVMTDSSNQGSVFGCRIPITMEQYELEIYKCSKAKI